MVGLSRDAAGRAVPSARERARGRLRLEDPIVGWSAALGITLLAFFLRVWKLGTPREFSFDETYYAKDAWSLLHHGYVQVYVSDANEKILDGTTTGIWKDEASMIVHPEVGQVADRGGRALLRDGPVRLADRLGGGRLADDPGDVPAGAAADRLDRARLRRRAAALLRRPALRAVAAGAAGHLRGVLPALRRRGPGQRPRLVPRQDGAAVPGAGDRTSAGSGRSAACCSGRGC